MWGVPFSYVGNVRWNEDLYQVTVAIEGDEPVTFGQMGKRTTQFRDDLERLIGALRRKTAETLTQLMPGTAPADIAQLSVLMPDGRAAQQKSVEAISEQLWHRLEGVVAGSGDQPAVIRLAEGSLPAWLARSRRQGADIRRHYGCLLSHAGA